jgi:Uma2 family endonuclease
MSTTAIDYLDSVRHLAPGGRLILHVVDFEDYLRLLGEVGETSHLRISYSNGRLEVMSPTTKHEKYKNLINELVLLVCDELEMDMISFGSFTMKIDWLPKGAEADDCFYIQHAADVARKDELELGKDPPPDLVVEIDLTRDSSGKSEIYASLGVPEMWRYHGSSLSVLKLVEGAYVKVNASLCFPFLSAEGLSGLIGSLSPGTHRARWSLRQWIRANKPRQNSESR